MHFISMNPVHVCASPPSTFTFYWRQKTNYYCSHLNQLFYWNASLPVMIQKLQGSGLWDMNIVVLIQINNEGQEEPNTYLLFKEVCHYLAACSEASLSCGIEPSMLLRTLNCMYFIQADRKQKVEQCHKYLQNIVCCLIYNSKQLVQLKLKGQKLCKWPQELRQTFSCITSAGINPSMEMTRKVGV